MSDTNTKESKDLTAGADTQEEAAEELITLLTVSEHLAEDELVANISNWSTEDYSSADTMFMIGFSSAKADPAKRIARRCPGCSWHRRLSLFRDHFAQDIFFALYPIDTSVSRPV